MFRIGDIVRSTNHEDLVYSWRDKTGIVVAIDPHTSDHVHLKAVNVDGSINPNIRFNIKYLELEIDPIRLTEAMELQNV